MTEYTIRYGPFYFRVYAGNDEDAINKAKQALYESSEGLHAHAKLRVELTAGAFDGNIFIEPENLTIENICTRTATNEVESSVPF
jgi:hypothetical protein